MSFQILGQATLLPPDGVERVRITQWTIPKSG